MFGNQISISLQVPYQNMCAKGVADIAAAIILNPGGAREETVLLNPDS